MSNPQYIGRRPARYVRGRHGSARDLEDNKTMFQQSVFEWKFQKELEGRTETPLTDELSAARASDREYFLTSSLDLFALKRDIIAQIGKYRF